MTRRSLFHTAAAAIADSVLAQLPLAGKPAEAPKPKTYTLTAWIEWDNPAEATNGWNDQPVSVLVHHRIEAAKTRLAKNVEAYVWGRKPEIDRSPPPGLAGLAGTPQWDPPT